MAFRPVPGAYRSLLGLAVNSGANYPSALEKRWSRVSDTICVFVVHAYFPVAFLAYKNGGYFGANINVAAKTRGVCKEQFYCSSLIRLVKQLPTSYTARIYGDNMGQAQLLGAWPHAFPVETLLLLPQMKQHGNRQANIRLSEWTANENGRDCACTPKRT